MPLRPDVISGRNFLSCIGLAVQSVSFRGIIDIFRRNRVRHGITSRPKSDCAAISAIILTISTLDFNTAHATGFRSPLRVRGKIGIDCHSMIWLFVAHTQILSGGHIGGGDRLRHSEKPGSMRFCKIGRAMTCTADYLDRTAPKSL